MDERSGLRPPEHAITTFPSWEPRRAIDHILVSETLRCEGLRFKKNALRDRAGPA